MTDPGRKLAALAIVVAMVGASLGYAPTTSYFSDGETANVAIEMPVAPVGNVGSDNPVAEGSPVNVTGVSSTDDGTITSYAWDFDGDGEIDATGMNQTHTYLDEGEYGVTLVVTDTAGLTDTATTAVTVENVPPTARAGSDRTVDVDEVVTFDASASSDPGADNLTYEWDLDGDGEYDAGGVEVDQQYRSEGTYAVTLQVSDGDGGLDTDTLSVEVQNVPPTADAGENLTVVTGEPTLDGTRSSEGDSSDTLTYEWDVDDDGTYEVDGAEPGHYYSENGTYNVTLQVSDGDGGTDTDTTTVTVEPDTEPPVVGFTTDRRSVNDKTVAFDATASSDNARIVGYQWDFGDGATTTGPTPTHTYDDPGDYNVTLTVTDSAGYETTVNVSIAIENVPPTADAGENQTIFAGEPLTLDASGSIEGDVSDTLSYEWTFDDGNATETSDPTVDHIYSENGTYNVTLQVSDSDGGTDTDNVTVTVEPDTEPPVADAVTTQTTATNKTIGFNGSGSGDNARIVGYQWDFGDGTTAAGPEVSHTYDDPGDYNVTLTVTDSASYETTANVSIAIENVPPTADAGPDLETTAGTPVTLDGSDSTAGDAHDTLSYGWDLDEDSTYEKSRATAEQIFRDEGTYNVTLRVDDGDGGVDTDTTTVTVENALPVADAGSDRTVPVNETVAFDGSTSSDPDGDTLTYEWDLDGDGAFDESGSNASHTYTANGTYTVTLRVDDGDGGIDTDTIDVTVES